MTAVKLQDLAALSKSLNEASDALSKQIAQVEGALNELKLGVSAWVTITRYETDAELKVNGKPETVTKVEYLGYGKYQGKWALLYCTSLEEYPEYETNVPLREAPRMERLSAVDKLPSLVEAIQAKAKEVAHAALTKATEVSALASALQKAMK